MGNKTQSDMIFLGKAANIVEAEFIKTVLSDNGVETFYMPGASRGMFGIEDNLNIAVRDSDKEKAEKILKQNHINLSNLGSETPFFASLNFNLPRKESDIFYYYLIFIGTVLLAFLVLIFFMHG